MRDGWAFELWIAACLWACRCWDRKRPEALFTLCGNWSPAVARSTEGGVPGEGGSDAPVGGPRNPQQIAAQKRVQQSQAQVDEVSSRSSSPRKMECHCSGWGHCYWQNMLLHVISTWFHGTRNASFWFHRALNFEVHLSAEMVHVFRVLFCESNVYFDFALHNHSNVILNSLLLCFHDKFTIYFVVQIDSFLLWFVYWVNCVLCTVGCWNHAGECWEGAWARSETVRTGWQSR